MNKKILMMSLIFTLMLSLPVLAKTSKSLDNFKETGDYEEGQFLDVSSSEWYAESIKTVYNLGLMKGTSEIYFNTKSNITLGETVALAARLNKIYYFGDDTFEQTDVWYRTYADYALENGIIQNELDYSKIASRGEFAFILGNALPEIAFKEINKINDDALRDVPSGDYYAKNVYKLYRAGILTGNDEYGTFAPYSNIDRASVAAIVSRIAKEDLRKTFTLKKYVYFPLEVIGGNIKYDFLGYVDFYPIIKNNGSVAIDSFEFVCHLYDAYKNPVYYYDYGSNEFKGLWNKTKDKALKPGAQTDGKSTYYSFMGYTGVKNMRIALVRAHAVDGTVYELDEEDYKWRGFGF